MGDGAGALTYFNDHEARTVEAVAERIIPGEEGKPGASDAGVVYYIDRAIAGFSTNLQRVYRLGLRELDAYCAEVHSAHYVDLAPPVQDDVVRAWFGPEVDGDATATPRPADVDADTLRQFFAVVREHAVEGYFCDPVYGGNRDAVGWRLVGFPGAQWGYTDAQMRLGYDAAAIPVMTLADLRASLDDLPPNERFYASEGK